MPVIFGPNYKHFREACALIDAGGGFSIRKYSELEHLLDLPDEEHKQQGIRSAAYVQSELGATDRIYNQLFG